MTMTMAMTIAMTMVKKVMMMAMMTTTTTITKTVALFSFEACSDHPRIVKPLSSQGPLQTQHVYCNALFHACMISTAMLSFMHAHIICTCMLV